MKTDMRVRLTKRLLKEALFRMIAEKPISKITITDLCAEAGVNRATFYKHYDSPVMILREISWDCANEMKAISEKYTQGKRKDYRAALEACMTYLYERRAEIRLLFSENAENYVNGFVLEIVKDYLANNKEYLRKKVEGNEEDRYLYAVMNAAAAYGLLEVWLVNDLDKTPKEIAAILESGPLYRD